jgi:hypothetical protein
VFLTFDSMRNLGLRYVSSVQITGASISAVALDLEEKVIYAASDRHNADADAEIEIWKVPSDIASQVDVSILSYMESIYLC